VRPTTRRPRTEASLLTRLRRHCERVLAALELPDRFDLADVQARLPAFTGRPLRVVLAAQTFPAPSGAWLRTASGDVIVIDRDASPLHRDHILAHELAHILLGHDQPDGGTTAAILPDLDPAVVHGVLARRCCRDTEEREAELLASLIMVRVTSPAEAAAAGAMTDRPLRAYLALQRLRPLWRDFAEPYDDIALERPRRRDDLLGWRDLDLRLYRRIIEICDGYRALRRFVIEETAVAAPSGQRRPCIGEHLLREAVALHRARLRKASAASPPVSARTAVSWAAPTPTRESESGSGLAVELARLVAHARARRYARAQAACAFCPAPAETC
jgi:hypothetical protein